MRYSIVCLFFILIQSMKGQDSVAYGKEFVLYEGVYLTYTDLRHNWPIPKEKIVTSVNKDQLDFYTKVLEGEKVEFVERDGNKAVTKCEEIWGYCQNNVIFINYKKSFYRIPVFGAISYFLGTVEVSTYSPGYNVFVNAPVSQQGTTKELREFLFDFYTGELSEFSIEKVEEMIKKDENIYKEFMALSRKKKKDLAAKYIRKFNEKHPIYFPKK